MGFKRTPEGRVFFQGADKPQESAPHETANDEAPRPPSSRRPLMSEQARNAAVSQTQIVTLLKTLNERLKLTQADRDQMMRELENHRSVIEELEDKAERNERIALDLEHKLERQALSGASEDILHEFEKTRALLLEKQTALENKQTQHHKLLADSLNQTATSFAALSSRLKNTETRQLEIDEKVEAAALQQAKLMRKVEKAIEDRARFMRKIERIEETVIQTRDSLNAKAMVLLTDQGVAGQEDITEETLRDPAMVEALRSRDNIRKQEPAPASVTPEKDPFTSPLFTSKPKEQESVWRHIAIVAGVAALGVIGFLAYENLSADNQSASQRFNEGQFSELSAKDAGWQAVNIEPAAGADSAAQEDLPPLGAPQPIESMNWAIEDTPSEEAASAEAEEQSAAAESAIAANDDVGAIDLQNEEEVAALLESNPEALARQLNEIEPERTTTAEPAPAPATTTATPPPVIEEKPAAPAKTESQLRSLIKNDTNLPNVVKAIEDQAFDGIPEAQHDLAAIYTAGHGGVEQNYKRAAFWFERAAENGIANASYNLGVLYHQGLGFDADINKALQWYTKAAEQGHPEAQYNLGIAHIEGIGVKYDAQKAAKYFASAANNGIMEAAYNLGLIYENGLLGDSNPDNALLWYKQAADQGSPEAREALQGLAQRLNLTTEDVNRLVESMRAADGIRQGTATTTAPEKETSIAPLNTQDTQVLTAQIQEYLMRSGLYPGPADGVGGPVTSDAIRSYQAQNGLSADGKVSQALLSHMLSNSG